MMLALSLWELRLRYAGTLGGMIWSVILPLTMVLVYWYVFAVGLRAQGPDNVPYIVWFLCGFSCWTLFNETLSSGVSCVTRSGHLVKNLVFPLEMLPTISVVVSQVTHAIMLVILLILLFVYKMNLSLYALQFFYYFLALNILATGFSFLLSAVNVFCRDLGQALSIILNILFWLTPIAWAPNMLSETIKHYMLFNPIYYIVNGYRESFIYHKTFWIEPGPTLSFWIVCAVIFSMGWIIFNRFKLDFADAM